MITPIAPITPDRGSHSAAAPPSRRAPARALAFALALAGSLALLRSGDAPRGADVPAPLEAELLGGDRCELELGLGDAARLHVPASDPRCVPQDMSKTTAKAPAPCEPEAAGTTDEPSLDELDYEALVNDSYGVLGP